MAPLNEIKQRSLLRSISTFSLLSALLTFLLFSPWFYGLTRFKDQLAAELFIFFTFLLSFPFLGSKGVFRWGERRIDFWVFLTFIAGFSYVVFSVLPYRSLLAFLRLAACVLFYILIRCSVRTDNRFKIFLWTIFFAGVFYSVYGLAQYYGFLPHAFWYQPNSLASRYVNGGHFAAFLFFPLFVGMALVASCRNRLIQGAVVTLILLVLSAFLLTKSRASWIAFILGFLIFIWQIAHIHALDRKKIGTTLLLIGAAGGLFLVYGGGREILGRFQELWQATGTSLDSKTIKFYSLVYRWKLWEGAFNASMERPWGWGLGTFSAIFPRFQIHSDRFLADYAHNEFAQVGVDFGIAGLVLLIGFLVFYFRGAVSFLRFEEVPAEKKIYGSSFVALLVSLTLVSQFDFPIRIYATSFFFVAFLALSAYLFDPPQEEKFFAGSVLPVSKKRPISKFLFASFVIVLAFFNTRHLFAQIHFEKGQAFEKDFEWQKALKEYEKAAHLASFHPDYYDALGSLLRKKALLTFNREEKEKFFEKTISAYQNASRLQPQKAFYYYFLAELYEKRGQTEKAQAEFLNAVSAEPNNPLFISEYAYFALRHSLTEEALRAFEKYKTMPFKEGTKSYLIDIIKGCYALTQDYSQLRRVIPNTPEGHFSLGQVLGEKERWDLAKEEFDLAVGLSPITGPSSSLPPSIADFYLSHNQPREALKIYQILTARNPQDGQVQAKIQDLTEKLKTQEAMPSHA